MSPRESIAELQRRLATSIVGGRRTDRVTYLFERPGDPPPGGAR